MNKIILASASERRSEILKMLGLEFEVLIADIDETLDKTRNVYDEIMRISYEKADYIRKKAHKDDIIISADTLVILENKILGKPKNKTEAYSMLKMLSGKTHKVATAVTVLSPLKDDTKIIITKVTFKELSDEKIWAYINTKEPLDKAGAYGIQGMGSVFVQSIEGDYFSVMGLSTSLLYEMFENAGLKLL